MCIACRKKIKENFQKKAVETYNEINEEKVTKFSELQSKLTNLSDVPCEDQYFGVINIDKKSMPSYCEWTVIPVVKADYESNKGLFATKREEINIEIQQKIKEEKLKTIVIVLESPHTDEFLEEDGWKSVGPACGSTGKNLKEWFPAVLLNYVPSFVDKENNFKAKYNSLKDIESGEYVIKLINAIQYQCSLGEGTKTYRDQVFRGVWEEESTKECFRKRLQGADPYVIINCCTKGNGNDKVENELRRLVQVEINKANIECLLLRAAHPSSVHFKNGLSCVDENNVE